MIILGDEVAKEFPRKIYPTNLVKTNRTGESGIKFRLCFLRGKSLYEKECLVNRAMNLSKICVTITNLR